MVGYLLSREADKIIIATFTGKIMTWYLPADMEQNSNSLTSLKQIIWHRFIQETLNAKPIGKKSCCWISPIILGYTPTIEMAQEIIKVLTEAAEAGNTNWRLSSMILTSGLILKTGYSLNPYSRNWLILMRPAGNQKWTVLPKKNMPGVSVWDLWPMASRMAIPIYTKPRG